MMANRLQIRAGLLCCLVGLHFSSCKDGSDDKQLISNLMNNSSDPEFGAFTGDVAFDGAHDELGVILKFVVERIDACAARPEFDSIDLVGMRANVDILTRLISEYKAYPDLTTEKIAEWKSKMDEPFSIEDRWAYGDWPKERRRKWQEACHQTMADLRKALAMADWDPE